MNIKQIRNATLIIEYAGKKFLVDPVFADKGTYPPFPNSLRQDENNPLVDLPVTIKELIDVDAVIVTHTHLDHIDDVAKESLPKDIKIFVQDKHDYNEMRECEFNNIEILSENTQFHNIKLIKTLGQHGRGKILESIGNVCGVVFKSDNEKTLYLAGDTVWYEEVEKTLSIHKPEVIIINGGDNQIFDKGSLIMGKNDIHEVHKCLPNSKLLITHMEAMNHWTLSRKELREFTKEKGFSNKVLIPKDGENYEL
ncbi:metal-dependent hydrolase [Sarcina ventriculi]|uniref:MBL fold metallo-hydrolase n=1 Tax=Sarcina ventriculi TaxID=1267 RepID=UPI000D878B58|nr:MBL fold metallo-hydrolase [Sarcina ventriculi]SPZ50901.1 metal-dependent hydrolase [Sarcina ventriculi]